MEDKSEPEPLLVLEVQEEKLCLEGKWLKERHCNNQ